MWLAVFQIAVFEMEASAIQILGLHYNHKSYQALSKYIYTEVAMDIAVHIAADTGIDASCVYPK